MCYVAAIPYIVSAVAAAGGAVASSDASRRQAHAAADAARNVPPPPNPTAEALVNPETSRDPNALAAISRKKLKVDLTTPAAGAPNIGSGLMIPSSSSSAGASPGAPTPG